jgi:hypothetical protein
MTRISIILAALIALTLGACGGAPSEPTAAETDHLPTAAVLITEAAPTQEPAPTATAPPQEPALSFEPATYRDEAGGFELDYPSDWGAPVQVQAGERASIVQLSDGGQPVLDIVLQRWDPKYDLGAYVGTRKEGWEASGFTITSEETFTLADGSEAARFIIETPEKQLAFFFVTPVGDRYLQLTGAGDLNLLIEISSTVRRIQ